MVDGSYKSINKFTTLTPKTLKDNEINQQAEIGDIVL